MVPWAALGASPHNRAITTRHWSTSHIEYLAGRRHANTLRANWPTRFAHPASATASCRLRLCTYWAGHKTRDATASTVSAPLSWMCRTADPRSVDQPMAKPHPPLPTRGRCAPFPVTLGTVHSKGSGAHTTGQSGKRVLGNTCTRSESVKVGCLYRYASGLLKKRRITLWGGLTAHHQPETLVVRHQSSDTAKSSSLTRAWTVGGVHSAGF